MDDLDLALTNISLISAPNYTIIVNLNFSVPDFSPYISYDSSGYVPYDSLTANDKQHFYWGATDNSSNPCVYLINGATTPFGFFSTPISNNFLMLQSTACVQPTINIITAGSYFLSFYYTYNS